MKETIFESLGLSPNEAKIYESLVEKGESSVSEIAINAQIHRRNAYDAIQRLIDKGLCFEIVSKKENRYNAVDPNKLVELFKEKENELQKILPDLQRKFAQRVAPVEAFIYRGLEGQKNIWRDIIRVAKETNTIGAKAGWFDPRLASAREAFFREANQKGVKFVQLFDWEVKEKLPGFFENYPAIDAENRLLPKAYSTESAVLIFGDYVVNYTGLEIGRTVDDVVFFLQRSKTLADSYRKWFKYMWEQSVPIQKAPQKS